MSLHPIRFHSAFRIHHACLAGRLRPPFSDLRPLSPVSSLRPLFHRHTKEPQHRTTVPCPPSPLATSHQPLSHRSLRLSLSLPSALPHAVCVRLGGLRLLVF